MARNSAKQRAKRQRRTMIKNARIYNQVEPRKLRNSAKKQLKIERSRRLWILPSMMDSNYRLGQTYPAASLLGLPTELRQRIFYQAFDTLELKTRASTIFPKEEDANRIERSLEARLREIKDPKTTLRTSQVKRIMALRQRVREFSCVSTVIGRDMKYVKQLWVRDMEEFFKQEDWKRKFEMMVPGFLKRMKTTGDVKEKEGTVVKAKQRGASIKRAAKCWRCMERHWNKDTMCPMARYDPERWQKLTKKMGGRRPPVFDTSLFGGKRIRFADD